MLKSFELDLVDLRLLSEVQRDASESNQALAERLGISAPTCLRRLRRFREAGYIEREVALLNPASFAPLLIAVIEVSLDRQDSGALDDFEIRACADDAVQQCYRVSPGPDFMLIATLRDMPDYQAFAQRLFTTDANVRNVKAFFSVKRAKFTTQLPLPAPADLGAQDARAAPTSASAVRSSAAAANPRS